MEERKFIKLKKEEFGIKEYIKRDLGKGKISQLDIEYTPVGEKIIVSTSRPGLVIGRKGEKINELTSVLKNRFKLENPHIEINEIEDPLFDAQLVADEIALALERMGNLKFKVIAYRKLQEIMNAGALGCEMRLTGKLPSERAKSWRFAEGYLKKAGEPSKEIDRAQATALTKTGIIGIKVAIMNPKAKQYDKIDIDEAIKRDIAGGGIVGSSEKGSDESESATEKSKIVEKKAKVKKSKKVAEKKEEEEIVEEVVKKVEVGKESVEEAEKEIATEIAEEVKEDVEIKEEIRKFDEAQKVKPEEDGTAISIETEVEEGVPEGTEGDIKEVEESEKDDSKTNKEDKLSEGKE